MRYQQQNEEIDNNKQQVQEQRFDGDRYRDGGRNMMLRSTLAVVDMQQQLTGEQREQFAATHERFSDRLIEAYSKQKEQRQAVPLELPKSPPPRSIRQT